MNEMNESVLVRIVTLLVLGVVLVITVVCICVVAIKTDRDLARPEGFALVVALVVGGLGGFSIWEARRSRRWRIVREQEKEDE